MYHPRECVKLCNTRCWCCCGLSCLWISLEFLLTGSVQRKQPAPITPSTLSCLCSSCTRTPPTCTRSALRFLFFKHRAGLVVIVCCATKPPPRQVRLTLHTGYQHTRSVRPARTEQHPQSEAHTRHRAQTYFLWTISGRDRPNTTTLRDRGKRV